MFVGHRGSLLDFGLVGVRWKCAIPPQYFGLSPELPVQQSRSLISHLVCQLLSRRIIRVFNDQCLSHAVKMSGVIARQIGGLFELSNCECATPTLLGIQSASSSGTACGRCLSTGITVVRSCCRDCRTIRHRYRGLTSTARLSCFFAMIERKPMLLGCLPADRLVFCVLSAPPRLTLKDQVWIPVPRQLPILLRRSRDL